MSATIRRGCWLTNLWVGLALAEARRVLWVRRRSRLRRSLRRSRARRESDMKRVPESYAASTRASGTPTTTGPGPSERGRVKQGMSPGTWPGNRRAGNQGPGSTPDNSAKQFASPLGSKAGG